MISEKQLERIKEKYPIGTRVKLNYMEDDYSVPSGTCGIVDFIDSEGQLHMSWDNGRTLALIVGVDSFEVIGFDKDYKGINI